MNPVLFVFLYFVLLYLRSSFHISDKICIFLGIIILYIDVKLSERYKEDNSYDSNKYISRHIKHAKFHFSTFMISVIFVIYITIASSLALSSQNKHSYERGIECCNQNNGTIDGYYCNFNYRNDVSIKSLDDETSIEYKAYCMRDEESLKELRPYDWRNYVDQ